MGQPSLVTEVTATLLLPTAARVPHAQLLFGFRWGTTPRAHGLGADRLR
jgi:hypothetical protein